MQRTAKPLSLPALQRDLLTVVDATDGVTALECKRRLEEARCQILADEAVADDVTALAYDGLVRPVRIDEAPDSPTDAYAITDDGRRALASDLAWRTATVDSLGS